MKTIKSEFIGTDATGKDFYRVIIVSESAPDSFPTSGADVDGVPDIAGIAAGSVLLTPDGNSVLYADDWSEGGGTGDDGIQSITISPTIQLTPSLNNYLPMSYEKFVEEYPGGNAHLSFMSEDIHSSTEYGFTVTPGSEWYVADASDPENVIFGDKGQPLTISATTDAEANLSVNLIAVESADIAGPDSKIVVFSLEIAADK